ncbi:efflux transporter outer membrane subunit [Ramlibacter monticola]|uniref:Efflux transporter outer membrane subunit n=1 Tax=Ramlibacter monticola TaxID=1926872 RepID=A0A936YZE3_9BURK|nr:efflux transporter outer membrane subunit [Ramlibacter monticola]MBL0390775.1 efflux transporter outer membrane subunit [Ramlibacter monticola]
MTSRRPVAALRPALLLLVLALGGCASAPTGQPAEPALPAAFRHAAPASAPAATPAATEAWWQVFQDPVLDELQATAAAGNTSLQSAAARLARARALVRGAEAARNPQVGLRAGASRQAGPIENAAGTQGNLFTLLADFSWEADLFGRLQQGVDAARLDAQAQEALLRDTRLLVQANMAQAYFELRALDAERAIVDAAARSWRDTVAITSQRLRTGSVAELELVRAQAELAAIETDGQALQRRRIQLEHALALLTGVPASSFELPPRDWRAPLPAIPPGVPATVLTRRPDIAAALRGVQAAQTRAGLARTAWFPTLTLTASGGSASPDLAQLLQASTRAWGIAGLVGAVLFDGGRREAGILQADADLEAAAVDYREHILVALREVEDQLASVQLLANQSQTATTAVNLGRRATTLAESRYRSGLASQLDVLDARRTELRNERDALQVRSAQYQATVRLIRALGGGWEVAALSSPP